MTSGLFHIPRRQTPEQVAGLFAAQRAADPIGVRIHLLLALGACFFAGWSTSYVEWCALPVLICFLVRMTGQHRVLEPLAFDRVLRLLLAWGAWVGVSVLWSAGAGWHEWLVDVKPLRFLALAVILWPVMDRRSWLVIALMAGIACGEMSQAVHLVTMQMGWSWAPFHRMPGRITGWWDPVSGGTVLCAGLGLWLAPALFGAGRSRVIGAIGVAATLVCIVLTGTRGAWIGGGALCAIAVAITPWTGGSRSRAFVRLGLLATLLVTVASAAYLLAGGKIADRLQRGWIEVTGAVENRDYTTDTGMRIAMWRWAIAAAKEHPVLGVGAGGYQPWVRAQTAKSAARLDAPFEAAASVHAQAHSWYLHTLATGGLIGFVLLGLLLWTAVEGELGTLWGIPNPLRTAAIDVPGRPWHKYGPGLALMGLALAGLFDTITVNQQPVYLFYLLVAMCLPSRPREGM